MRVKNKKIIRTLTLRMLKAAKLRNMVAVCAIALTSILFTTVFTIGGNMIASMQEATMRQVGTSAHGGLKYLTQEQYDNFKESPLIRDISYNIIIGFAENEALQKKQTEIRYSEDKAAQWNFSYPTVGTMPKGGMELACSTITLDMLGIPHELGQKIPLEFTIYGRKYNEEFTLSGFWPGDDVMRATQVWLSREYTDLIIGVPKEADMSGDFGTVAGTIHADVWFSNSLDIEGKMDALLAERGYASGEINVGVNWAYAGGEIDLTSVMIVVFFVLLILVSGYLIIYNIFTISVTGDIRFYGLLKTIGTTGRQLRRIVRGQALLLSALGIPLGLMIGWLLGYVLTPVLMSMTNLEGRVTQSANPFIFIFASLFSLITVFISCRKPGRIATKVSPVEAVRYAEGGTGKRKEKRVGTVSPLSMALANVKRSPKKLAVVILSLSLSLILLNSVYSIVQGFDMELYLSETIVSDFSAADHSVYSAMITDTNYEGVDDGLLSAVSELPGLEDMADIYYYEDSFHQLSPQGHENMRAALDFLAPHIEKNWPDIMDTVNRTRESGIAPLHVYGVGKMAVDIMTADSAPIDFEKLASGGYVLATHIASDYDNEVPPVYGVGDKVPLTNKAGETREFEVLALVEYPYSISSQHSHIIDGGIIMADDAYLDFYGDRQPMMTIFNVTDEYIPFAEEWLTDYCENGNSSLDYRSRNYYKGEFENMQNTYLVLGGTLSFVLALIGILNFLNAIFTSILARRREFAMLQSVGMTGKQLKTMLFGEGISYAALTILFTATAGTLISRLIVQTMAGGMWFFKWTFTLTPLVCAIAPLLLICALIPLACYRFMRKESIVERLRME